MIDIMLENPTRYGAVCPTCETKERKQQIGRLVCAAYRRRAATFNITCEVSSWGIQREIMFS